MDDVTGEATELLQAMIRTACVNDGTAESGGESRNADIVTSVLECPGLDLERYEPRSGRSSVVARLEGSDPTAPSVLLLGHTDVVPANPAGWRHDPFGGELVDGEVWGRGAIDMLNLTATMAVALRRLAASGFRPRGTLAYAAVADEEALGTWGTDWLLANAPEAVQADYVITESGGIPGRRGGSTRLPVIVAEKGSHWCTLRVTGTPGHASQPFRSDNALVTAAEVVRRLAEYRPPTQIHETWRRYVAAMGFPPDVEASLLDPEGFVERCAELPIGMARNAHACTHTTFAPTVVHGGTKTNVIPDRVDLQVDIRTLPGQTAADIEAMLDDALGELAERVTVVSADHDPSTASPVDTPLWDALGRVCDGFYPDSHLVPSIMAGATDARFFRRAGMVAYGFGLFSTRLRWEDYASMFHGHDERVDVESLGLSARMWEALARDVLA